MKKIEIIPLNNIPKININYDIPSIIIKALKSQKLKLEENDILVVAHKIISISEDCFFNLENIKVSRKAKDLSRKISILSDKNVLETQSKEIIKFISTRK